MTTLDLDAVILSERHRYDMGDIKGLAESMTEVGLLQPIVVTPDHHLIAGHRRLMAARSLGWSEIEVSVASNLTTASSLLRAEADENTCRKAFTPTEAERIATAIEESLRPLVKPGPKPDADGANLAPSGKTRDIAAQGVGYGRSTIKKVREVREVAEDTAAPAPVREAAVEALAEMDRTGKVDRAHKTVRQAESAHIHAVATDGDAAYADLQFQAHLARQISAAHKGVLAFDAEEVGRRAEVDQLDALEELASSFTNFAKRARSSASTLRVIAGGR